MIWGDHHDDRDALPPTIALMLLCVTALCIILAQLQVFGAIVDTIGGLLK